MNMKTMIAAAAASVVMAFGANAGTVAPGTYEILNSQVSAGTAHGVYLKGFLPYAGYNSERWSIQEDEGSFATVTAGALDFEGSATNGGVAGGGFDFEASLVAIAGPGNGPECANPAACSHLDASHIDYFNSADSNGFFGTLTGTGSLSGWLIELFVNDVEDMKPPQLGEGGSWHAGNESQDGFATWLTWVATGTGSGGYGTSGIGDINWLLGDSGTSNTGGAGGAEVPLPAAGWLMIAGLGGLAALRRRQTA